MMMVMMVVVVVVVWLGGSYERELQARREREDARDEK